MKKILVAAIMLTGCHQEIKKEPKIYNVAKINTFKNYVDGDMLFINDSFLIFVRTERGIGTYISSDGEKWELRHLADSTTY